jgi:hypothetical protein
MLIETKLKSNYFYKEKKAKKKGVGYLGRGVAVKVFVKNTTQINCRI